MHAPFTLKKGLKRNYRQEMHGFLPAELERGTGMLQFDVCCKAIDQNLDYGFGLATIGKPSMIPAHKSH